MRLNTGCFTTVCCVLKACGCVVCAVVGFLLYDLILFPGL